MNKMFSIFTTLAISAILPVSASAISSPIDSWYDQKVRTGRQSISGDARSYHTGASASYRISPQSNYLMSINPPRVSTGCGGIDIFMGSASFLRKQYLVERFEGMIQAAPYVMMDIAVNALNQQLGGAVSRAQSVIDRLNQLQFDECSSAKVMVTHTLGVSGMLGDRREEIEGAARAEWGVKSGTSGFWRGMTEDWAGLKNEFKSITHTDIMSGCSDSFKSVFAPGSMIDNVLYSFYDHSVGIYADLIRGFIGDVHIMDIHDSSGNPTGNLRARVIRPCLSPDTANLHAIAYGYLQVQQYPEFKCIEAQDARADLGAYVSNLINDIIANLKSGDDFTITPEQEAIIDVVTLPIMDALDTAVMEKLEGPVELQITEIIALNLAYNMVVNFQRIASEAISEGERVIQVEKGAVDGASTHQCKYEVFDEGFGALLRLRDDAETLLAALVVQYNDFEYSTSEVIDRLFRLSEIRRELAIKNQSPLSKAIWE